MEPVNTPGPLNSLSSGEPLPDPPAALPVQPASPCVSASLPAVCSLDERLQVLMEDPAKLGYQEVRRLVKELREACRPHTRGELVERSKRFDQAAHDPHFTEVYEVFAAHSPGQAPILFGVGLHRIGVVCPDKTHLNALALHSNISATNGNGTDPLPSWFEAGVVLNPSTSVFIERKLIEEGLQLELKVEGHGGLEGASIRWKGANLMQRIYVSPVGVIDHSQPIAAFDNISRKDGRLELTKDGQVQTVVGLKDRGRELQISNLGPGRFSIGFTIRERVGKRLV
jgi:hypothetical protein